MPCIQFPQALKFTRRSIYRFPNAWRVAILCESRIQAEYAFRETVEILTCSSLAVEKIDWIKRQITTERGGRIEFFTADNADAIQGKAWTQIIWCMDPRAYPEWAAKARAWLRSPVLQPEDLVEHECVL